MPQNQYRLKSEYAKSFKTFKESAQEEYCANVKFRVGRRNQEVSHQPWAWLDVDLSEDDYESQQCENIKSFKTESTQSSNKKSDTEIDCSTPINSNFDASGAVEISEDESDEKLIEKLKKKAMKRAKEITTESQKNQCNSEMRRPHHPIKGHAGTFQIRKPKNSEEAKPAKNLASINQDKLFLSYGWGSKTTEDNHKKTFNIKSDIDVYPSAIRALKMRQYAKEKSDNERPKTAWSGKNRQSSHHIDLDNKAAMEWLSEYQLRFPIYDNEVYRRGLANLAPRGQSARLDTPRTCRI